MVRWFLEKPVRLLADRFTSHPEQENVSASLSQLYAHIITGDTKKGELLHMDSSSRVIIFSDHHKGARNGSDDFARAADNYQQALAYYNEKGYTYFNLGDAEELWENSILAVLKHNKTAFELEKRFVERSAMYKVIGNHDLFWGNDPFASLYLKKMYGQDIPIHTGLVIRMDLGGRTMDIFCTHGHQGDKQSDGNAFSKWFVSWIWGPLQSYLRINTNRPSSNNELKTLHNTFMYNWSCKQKNLLLITGHTHQPVFRSLTHLERLYLQKEEAEAKGDHATVERINREIPKRRQEYGAVQQQFRDLVPRYFNTGCCCYEDGNMTGIEIADGKIRLVKWQNGERNIAEETLLAAL